MKLKLVALTALSFALISALIFSSCRRNEFDTDTTETENNTSMEKISNDVVSIADQASLGDLKLFKTRGCATVTRDTVSVPHTIVIDFGSSNCLCADGVNRRGKILVNYTGKYKDSGATKNISYDAYYVNDNQLKGIKTVHNNGTNAAGNVNYDITVNDTLLLNGTTQYLTHNATRNREYIAGYSTLPWADDKYSITGNASGLRANGIHYTATITQPLIWQADCTYKLIQGEIQLQPQGKAMRTINFGTGTCDNDATVTINGKTHNIKIK